jgi:hypothetical protein
MPEPALSRPCRDASPAQERGRAARRLRDRFERARRGAAVGGVALAFVVLAVRAARLPDLALLLEGRFVAFAALLLAGGGAAPWAVPGPFWRRVYRRKLQAATSAG